MSCSGVKFTFYPHLYLRTCVFPSRNENWNKIYIDKANCADLDTMLGIEEVDPSRVSSESEREGGRVVSFTRWPPLQSGEIYIHTPVCVCARACSRVYIYIYICIYTQGDSGRICNTLGNDNVCEYGRRGRLNFFMSLYRFTCLFSVLMNFGRSCKASPQDAVW